MVELQIEANLRCRRVGLALQLVAIEQLKRADEEGMLRSRWQALLEVVDTPDEAVAWCLKQQRRKPPSRERPADGIAYRKGVMHGLLVATASLVVVAAVSAARK